MSTTAKPAPAKKSVDKPGVEVRSCRAVELRATKEGDKTKIVGYAAVFNSRSDDLGGFVEIVKPGAFTRALREKQDVKCLFNHNRENLLGRIASTTLRLEEDHRGLKFECLLPDTVTARELVGFIERGDISGCSFSFRPNYDGPLGGTNWIWPPDSEPAVRELIDVDLYDVGPVTDPAYQATEVAVRSFEEAKAALAKKGDTPNLRAARVRLAEAEVAAGH